MKNFPETTEESRLRWEANADCWDKRMGNDSNFFHCRIVRPNTEKLLNINEGDLVLDAACGNGNFSQRLVDMGARVVAFDYSEKLIEHAKRRRCGYPEKISFHTCDATDKNRILALMQERSFDKAVANMAVMDIADIGPLLHGIYEVLKSGGIFVFSTHHPCFMKPEGKYKTACIHEGESIRGQPVLQLYYHRTLGDILDQCFDAGFVMNGFYEEYDDDPEMPVIIIVRLKKN